MPVTPEAPATSQLIDFTEPHSVVMPSSEEYRKTGELPSKDDRARTEPLANETEDESGNQDDSASSESAAASEAAPTEEQRRTQQPDRTQKEKRWQKRERELKELRAENARLKAQGGEPRSDRQQASQPAAQAQAEPAASASAAEPGINDVDPKTGKPVYATLGDYLKAHSKWNREEAVREVEQKWSQRQQETERAAIGKSLKENVDKVKHSFPDYDQVVNAAVEAKEADGRSPIFYTPGSHIDNFLLSQPDRGAALLYHVCKNASDPAIRGIFARTADGARYQLSMMDQIARLAVLADKLAATNGGARRRPAAAAATANQQRLEGDQLEDDDEGEFDDEEDEVSGDSSRQISQAPRPPRQTSGKGAVGKDPVVEAVETGDSETYMNEVNRVALARRKKKG
jgi:hypothetical protein